VTNVTLSVFQLYLQHLTSCWNVSSVTLNVPGVIWNASSVYIIHALDKKENWNLFGVVCLRTKRTIKNERESLTFIISKITCPNQGLLMYHFQGLTIW
jgi:hypothetical protein